MPDMSSPFFWRDKTLNTVGKNNQSNLVIALDGRIRQDSGDFSGAIAFQSDFRSKTAAGGTINQEHNGLFALFAENLYIGAVHPRRNIPVDSPDIITRNILAHLFKLHATPAKRRFVFTGKDLVGQIIAFDVNTLNFFEKVGG